MRKKIDAEKVGQALIELAELMTVEDAEMTADELVNAMEGRVMAAEEAGCVREYLST